MKGSWRAAEAWHCVAGLESLKKGLKGSLVRVQPSCSGDTRIFEMPGLYDSQDRACPVGSCRYREPTGQAVDYEWQDPRDRTGHAVPCPVDH